MGAEDTAKFRAAALAALEEIRAMQKEAQTLIKELRELATKAQETADDDDD